MNKFLETSRFALDRYQMRMTKRRASIYVIEPLFMALGYDTADCQKVQVETTYKGTCFDYILNDAIYVCVVDPKESIENVRSIYSDRLAILDECCIVLITNGIQYNFYCYGMEEPLFVFNMNTFNSSDVIKLQKFARLDKVKVRSLCMEEKDEIVKRLLANAIYEAFANKTVDFCKALLKGTPAESTVKDVQKHALQEGLLAGVQKFKDRNKVS